MRIFCSSLLSIPIAASSTSSSFFSSNKTILWIKLWLTQVNGILRFQDQALVTQDVKRCALFNLTLSSIILEIMYNKAFEVRKNIISNTL